MSKLAGESERDRQLRALIETADACHAVSGGFRLRFGRTEATLQFVISAIEANPSLRFRMTRDATGTGWLEMRTPYAVENRLESAVASNVTSSRVVA
jgi:hypothetical protein